MQTVLNQMNALPGIVGSMVYDADGLVLGQAFPALFDSQALVEAARVLTYGVSGLEVAAGAISMLDLRFGESRIVVRPIAGASLLLLCTAQANLQFLNISVGMAIPKIEKWIANKPALPTPVAPIPAAQETKAMPSQAVEGDAKKLKGFENVFLKMDSWIRKQGGD